jgi:uncharacterized protein (TIGR00251 family)
MSAVSQRADGVSIAIKVKAGARRTGLTLEPEQLRVEVQAPAVDGKANAAVIALLAERIGCKKSAISIVRGEHDTRKVVLVAGATATDVLARLG